MGGQMGLLPGFTIAANKKFRAKAMTVANSLRNRMLKAGFSVAGYDRDRLIGILGAAVGKPCPYCQEKIRVSTMSPDHTMPISRGGNPWEIQVTCQRCNRRKGRLSDEEFRKLLAFCSLLAPEAGQYILRMMTAGAAFPQMRRALAGMAEKTKAVSSGSVPVNQQ
jgi:hypothetical protein